MIRRSTELPVAAALLLLLMRTASADTDVSDPCQAWNGKALVDYAALHSCFFRGIHALSVPALVGLVVLAFYVLAQAAQHHFSPVVAKMAGMMRLSASTGGVTLLALGNGAPDVFSSVAAVWGGTPRIGLGAIVSAGLFVSAFVVGFVALAAAPFPLHPLPFIRDLSFYLLGALLMFSLYLSGRVYAWQAAALVALYLVFVAVVFAMDLASAKAKIPPLPASPAARDSDLEPCAAASSADKPSASDLVGISNDLEGGVWKQRWAAEVQSLEGSVKEPKNPLRLLATLVRSLLCSSGWQGDINKWHHQLAKVGLLWQLPVEFALRSTIPAVDPSQWNRFYASANLVCCPLIFLYIISSAVSPYKRMVFIIPWIDFPLWLLILLQGSVLAVAHFLVTKEPLTDELLPVVVVTSFVMSVFWISFVAGELVSCLATLGMLLKLPPALLGLTVLAWGNSIGDLVADVAVARAGQPAMAMAGCFAGPMFNMLVGFGLALAVKASRMHPSPYLLEYNPSIVVAFFFLFASLVGSLLVITWCKFQVPRFWGFCLIGLYISFVVVSISNASML